MYVCVCDMCMCMCVYGVCMCMCVWEVLVHVCACVWKPALGIMPQEPSILASLVGSGFALLETRSLAGLVL